MVRVPAPTNISAGWVVPVLVAVVLASRVQAILLNTELNPDEGQLLAQVMRLAIDPVPWRGVDGTTGGPLNTWFLALFHALGMPLAYAWVHGLAAAMLASIPVFVYATLRQLGGARSAAAAGLAAALTIALSQGANFAHFSSELLPAVVECAVVLLIAVRLARPGRAGLLDLIAALLVGTLPWTKLQSVLGAAVLGLWIVHVGTRAADRAQGAGPGRDWRRLLPLLGAMALPSVVVLGSVLAGGAGTDFWMSYVVGNASYVGVSTLAALAWKIFRTLQSPPSRLLLGSAGFVALWWVVGRPGRASAPRPAREALAGVGLLAAVTLFAVLLPRDPFPHYQILLIAPLSLVAGLALQTWDSGAGSMRRSRLAGPLFAVLLLGALMTEAPAAVRDARATQAFRLRGTPSAGRRIAHVVLRVAPDARRMVVWGWMPSVYVESGLTPGTRHAVGHFLIDPGPAQAHLRASLLQDVRRERPEVIVDAVAGGCFLWKWDSTQRLESFPELAEHVRNHYVLAAEESMTGEGDPVRVYVSKEYLARHVARGAAPEVAR